MEKGSDVLNRVLSLYVIIGLFFISSQGLSAKKYRRASEDAEVVKNKLFPKKKKLEAAVDFGTILNQSYINSLVLNVGGSYFVSEEWGFNAEAMIVVSNEDKFERTCIESFYNDFNNNLGSVCPPPGDPTNTSALSDDPNGDANMGPAYVPIRELKYVVTANAVWNPVYGKQLFFLRGTGHFDLFVNMGAGIAMSDFYPQANLRNGKASRGALPLEGSGETKPGIDPSETDLWGVNGRPDPEQQTNFLLSLGVGQKYHFLKRMTLKAEMRSYTLVGTDRGFEFFLTLWGGIGIRL